MERTDFAQPIGIDGDTMPAGIITRLEQALDRMEAEIEEQHRSVTDAQVRLTSLITGGDEACASMPASAE